MHWKGGHRALCPQIKRGGGAEQYHANTKCKEAVALAVTKCAADTKGQTCYICMEGAERRHTANEGEMLFRAPDATLDDCLEAEIICEDVAKRYTRTFGAAHPLTGVARSRLMCAQGQLRIRRGKAELASDFSRLSPEDQALFPELAASVAAGISCPDTKKRVEKWMQAAQEGKGVAKAPSIKEMKATIRKAGFGVADLVEKSEVVKRYQEALARLGK